LFSLGSSSWFEILGGATNIGVWNIANNGVWNIAITACGPLLQRNAPAAQIYAANAAGVSPS
jgi:hypothetical protein